MADYGEILCQAVDTILSERLKSVSFDSTILCTIVDDSRRLEGIYTVSNGSAKFDAYSQINTYRKNNNVYVQIPGGDFDQQKFIVAKKTDNTDEPLIYKNLFDSLVDVSGNMINSFIPHTESGLTANLPEDVELGWNDAITLWSYNLNEGEYLWENNKTPLRREFGIDIVGYSRLGLQADFQSWLNPFYYVNESGVTVPSKIIEGDYGLRLRVEAVEVSITGEMATEEEEKAKPAFYDVYLDTSSMNGNPYNFETFFQQNLVVDIGHLSKITRMELQFYEKSASFVDAQGNAIPHTDFLGNRITPNLFVKDCYLSFGYDVNEFDEEMIKIFTMDSNTYIATVDNEEDNHKKIQLRWIHKLEDGSFKSITEKDNIDFELRWYRYELGRASADGYSGVYWKYLSKQFKNEEGVWEYTLDDPAFEDWNKNTDVLYREPSFFTTWLLPDVTLQQEQLKAILLYNDEVYYSNILTITNEKEVVSKPTVDAVQALSINCEDSTFGNYRIYNQGNMLIDLSQSSVVREFKAYFKSALDKNSANKTTPDELIEADSIEWIIPKDKSMIVLDPAWIGVDGKIKETTRDENDREITIWYEDEEKTKKILTDDGEYYYIVRYCDENGIISHVNTQNYRIRGYYSQNYSNNTIKCRVVKDKITYTAVKELTFGVAGTTGTDATLVLDFDNGITAMTIVDTDAITVTARLYDYENNEVQNLGNRNITWAWKENTDSGLISLTTNKADSGKLNQVELKLNNVSSVPSNNYHILQCTLWKDGSGKGNNSLVNGEEDTKVSGWGDCDLVAYLPIPIRASKTYEYINGPTTVMYDSAGYVKDYYQNPFVIYYKDEEGRTDTDYGSNWTITNGVAGEEAFTPKINSYKIDRKDPNTEIGYRLEPINMYVDGANEKLCIVGYMNDQAVWSQPLLVMQNRYPSPMINKWDGSLTIDEEENVILAAQIGAGSKDSENRFSGVLMGDWGRDDTEASLGKTGLYGFHQGAQSFALVEDGTMFLGKAGRGRLILDGNNSYIESDGFKNNLGGAKLDFDDGILELRNPESFEWIEKSSNYEKVDYDSTTGEPSIELVETEEAKTALIHELYVKLDATQKKYPFNIYNNFKVDWAGNLEANNAKIQGAIIATSGNIGGCKIANGLLEINAANIRTINANTITTGYLNADRIEAGTITGNHIAANTITANNIQAHTITATEINAESIGAAVIKTNSFTAKFAEIENLMAETIESVEIITDELRADVAEINEATITRLESAEANIKNLKTEVLDAVDVTISNLKVDDLYFRATVGGTTYSRVSTAIARLEADVDDNEAMISTINDTLMDVRDKLAA